MYVRPISARLFGGRSTPATRAILLNLEFRTLNSRQPRRNLISKLSLLFLSLLVLGVRADHTYHTLAVNHLALVANFPNGSPNFHVPNRLLVTIRYASTVEVIRRQLNQNSITGKNSDEMLAHLSRNMR